MFLLLLNEERQLKRDEALNVIALTTQFTHNLVAHNRGCGRGRGRGLFSNQVYFQMAHNSGYQHHTPYFNIQSSIIDASTIICHNCEGKGRIARVCPSPRTSNGTRSFGKPVSNRANTQPLPTQDWLMYSGTMHNMTVDFNNLDIHFEYQGPEEVILGNGSELPISHIGKSSIIASAKKFKLEGLGNEGTTTHMVE
ncbi:hypothetical protein H5410_032092 [Solanum commersonii]|uniref:CCHC-type domain-containing protein n=1 Tax=Solanum commersonii TaxID=4109 RepID=A0A9J5YK24_SOLCO|nr:hypothetical protein H5410_032092 [Solanum commersonii]